MERKRRCRLNRRQAQVLTAQTSQADAHGENPAHLLLLEFTTSDVDASPASCEPRHTDRRVIIDTASQSLSLTAQGSASRLDAESRRRRGARSARSRTTTLWAA